MRLPPSGLRAAWRAGWGARQGTWCTPQPCPSQPMPRPCQCLPWPIVYTPASPAAQSEYIPGGSICIRRIIVVRGAVVHDEADQSGLFLCVVTLVPADPDVGVLGEEVFFSHSPSSSASRNPPCLWARPSWGKSAQCTSTLRCPVPSRSLGLGMFMRS